MKAIYYSKYGSPEVLQLKEIPKPTPKDDEVLVEVHSTSVNSWDWDLLTGKPYLYRLLFGLFSPRKKVIGCDIAGRVIETGKNVTEHNIGDEVFGDISGSWGGFAEYACANEKALSKKPPGMSFDEAAAIPQAGVLALQSLIDKKQLKKGDKVLINGAGGGVGTFALQIAKSLETEVTCVDKAAKLKMLRSLGSDHVIDYNQEDFTQNGKCYDLIIDMVASRSIFRYKRSLSAYGVFVMVGGTISAILQAAFIGPLISMFGNKKIEILAHKANKHMDRIIDLYKEGKLKPVIDKRFSLIETPKALKYIGDGLVKGKIIISVKQH